MLGKDEAAATVRRLVARHAAGEALSPGDAAELIAARQAILREIENQSPVHRELVQRATTAAYEALQPPPVAEKPPSSPVNQWTPEYAAERIAAFRAVELQPLLNPLDPRHEEVKARTDPDLADLAIAYNDPQHPDHQEARDDIAAAHWRVSGDGAGESGLSDATQTLSVKG